ncbi:MAG: hypothetical protein PWP54_1125 [Thermosipho sp. (in: thermotogales)]|nr:hypothetical protein [Thermosipho sp. (in: thermotogales)]
MEGNIKRIPIGIEMPIDTQAGNNLEAIMAGTVNVQTPTLLVLFLIQKFG